MNRQPHLLCLTKDVARTVLLPGDPARSDYIAQNFLKDTRLITKNREYTLYTGIYKGLPISICSTGIGAPSTAIAVEELANAGAKLLIRVGTCGGALKKEIKPGSIIIPTATIREEGTTKEYIPIEFPAVADYNVVKALEESAKMNNLPYSVGINRTHDAFYGTADNIKRWGQIYLNERMENWKYPLISSEMECSPLFIIATLRGIMAGAVLAVNANPEPLKEIMKGSFSFSVPKTKIQSTEAEKSVDRAILTALEASKSLENML